jgi:hypothetical protein
VVLDDVGKELMRQRKNLLPGQEVSTATICGCCRYIRRRRLVEVITLFRLAAE